MSRERSNKLITAAIILGSILIIVSLATVAVHHFSQKSASENLPVIVENMKSMRPEETHGITGEMHDPEMPVVEIEGNDFVGMIEVPKYSKALPVYSSWEKNKITDFPCRYMGSMYDGSLIVGTVEDHGQSDIAKGIAGGDELTFTDVTGLKYNYIITDAYKTKDVSTEALTAIDGELVLFVRSTYGTDYMVICCNSR